MPRYSSELWLSEPRDKVFEFFSDARNLEALTPPWLNFRIETPAPIAMQAGALIDYRLRFRGVPLRWRTEIQVWEPPVRFVDAELRGPFLKWVHTHSFVERDGGTLCRDDVEYAVFGGALIDRLLVRRDVEKIFAYREKALRLRFPAAARSRTFETGPGAPIGFGNAFQEEAS